MSISLGELYDQNTTIRLKIEAKKTLGLDEDVKILETQRGFITIAIQDYLLYYQMNPSGLPDFSKMKVYASENKPPELSNIQQAIFKLEETVIALWNHQEFINLDKYKEASLEELRGYIDKLHKLNQLRNYYIDNINSLFRRKVNGELSE